MALCVSWPFVLFKDFELVVLESGTDPNPLLFCGLFRGPNPSKVLQQLLVLQPEQQLSIFHTLLSHLTDRGMLPPAAARAQWCTPTPRRGAMNGLCVDCVWERACVCVCMFMHTCVPACMISRALIIGAFHLHHLHPALWFISNQHALWLWLRT